MKDDAASSLVRRPEPATPAPPDSAPVEEIAEWLNLYPEPFATFHVQGMYGLRRHQEAEVDEALRNASEALLTADLPDYKPKDPLRELVNAVLIDAGLGSFRHAKRDRAIHLRRSIVRALLKVARVRGLTPLRARAATIADEIQAFARPMPISARELVEALVAPDAPRVAQHPLELGLTDERKPVLRLGSSRLEYSKGREGVRGIGLGSGEGRFLIRLAPGRPVAGGSDAVRSHLRDALRRCGSTVTVNFGQLQSWLSQPLRIGPALAARLAQ